MKEPKLYSPRILVVDDEQAILDEFQEILRPATDSGKPECKLEDLGAELFGKTCQSSSVASFDLVLCHQGDEAVEKVRVAIEEDKPFAVAFLDVRMPPGPDGVWTAEHIRALDPYVQMVIVTAYSDVDPLGISNRISPKDKLLYLQKPFHPHEIRQFASALGTKWLAERQLEKQAIELVRSNEQLRHEIAEHKRTEEKRQLLSGAIMSTDESVYITDMEDKIIFVNKAFCETYGYKQEDIVGKDSNILWSGNSESENTTSVFQASGSAWEVGFYHKRKDGSTFPVSLSKSIIRDSNKEEIAAVGMARDVSDRIRVENGLRKVNLRLTERIRLRSELAVMVSDVLEAFLAAFKNIISDAKAVAPGKIGLQSPENLEFATKNIDRVGRLVSDFLDVLKIDADERKLEQTWRRLQPLVSEVLEALSPVAAEKKD